MFLVGNLEHSEKATEKTKDSKGPVPPQTLLPLSLTLCLLKN